MPARLSVYELAREYGVTSRAVLQLINDTPQLTGARSASSRLTDAEVRAVRRLLESTAERHAGAVVEAPTAQAPEPAGVAVSGGAVSEIEQESTVDEQAATTDGSRDGLEALVRQAFDRARESGKEDWRHMSTGVLKNRLSQILGEKFDQARFGYQRMTDLVQDLPDLLAVDDTRRPPVLYLLPEPPRAPSGVAADAITIDESITIRPDHWAATIDYASGEPYFLVAGTARASSRIEGSPDIPVPLPTITQEILDTWRADFAESTERMHSADEEEMRARVHLWLNERRGTRALPGVLQGLWNLYLKRAVVARLRNWYAAVGLPVPADLIIERKGAGTPPRPADDSRLREALIATIRRMSSDELRAVQLPASALLHMVP
ncbi:OST-HTH/LOTUS domain-containing protein [Cellulomonas rhizosphaerae]|uniref:HTH OST-type domain-containing protein n=1 Tax=Cellulomonas rhizosphaerae TaxID=2293719 RepID=A0A413RLS5_9CELL|nr:OST-HTH/LOTUS domain-containing protein [Cellulomonas rhizosphaerae]RHA40989.1 hypothetical protein D1825_09370 [Cellulomonas rhizosphaerae]